MFTVKQLSDMAGVTSRTLRYYDEIGLLQPTTVGENGYRYYSEDALLRLQQILFYRELDVPLSDIGEIMRRDDFDVLKALESHQAVLAGRLQHLQALVETVDKTILHLKGRHSMQAHQLFDGLKERQQDEYAEEAEQKYGAEAVQASQRRWQGYSEQQRKAVLDEGNAIYSELAAAIPRGAQSEEVQALVGRWRRHLEYFWTPQLEQLQGLALTYRDDPRFRANFDKVDTRLAEFMVEAVAHYVVGAGKRC